MTGSLTIVGTGIKLMSHLTTEAQSCIEQADKLFILGNGSLAEAWLTDLNANLTNLAGLYAKDKPRHDTYAEMVQLILKSVRAGQRVCAVFYGHPGVFVTPSHEAVRQARAEGYSAQMWPGISAEDCLFADLGIDPATDGCQSYEATDFLIRPRQFDTSSHLILWQIGVIGHLTAPVAGQTHPGLAILAKKLAGYYPAGHLVYIYEAATLPGMEPLVRQAQLHQLPQLPVSAISTLYVPPAGTPTLNTHMLQALGLA